MPMCKPTLDPIERLLWRAGRKTSLKDSEDHLSHRSRSGVGFLQISTNKLRSMMLGSQNWVDSVSFLHLVHFSLASKVTYKIKILNWQQKLHKI